MPTVSSCRVKHLPRHQKPPVFFPILLGVSCTSRNIYLGALHWLVEAQKYFLGG